MRKVMFRGRETALPECLEELTPDQYVYYIYLASWLAAGTITLERWRMRWFSFLAGLRGADYTLLRDDYAAEAERLAGPVTDAFLEDNAGAPVPSFATCRNLLPEYRGLKGPEDWLNDLPFGKFVECSTMLECAASSGDPSEAYREMARTLYGVPEGKDVPEVLVWHAPVLFGSVWKALQSGPIEMNGKMIDFSIIFKSSGERRPDDKTGWAGISFEVASTGIFGNVTELDNVPFWAVMMYLYKCKFEYLNDKSKNKK